MERFKKRWIAGSAALGAIILVVMGNRGSAVEEVEITVVGTGEIIETIPASGTIRPELEIPIAPDVSGEIVLLPFREGEKVRKGDTLVKIRQDVYLSMVERAEASLGTLQADLMQQNARTRQAGMNLERTTKLFYRSAVSKSELETAQAEYEIANGQLSAAKYGVRSGEAALKEARENLAKTIIRAPIEGTLTRVYVQLGERVVGTSQMAGTDMLKIADLSRLEVVTEIGENDIVRIHPGDSARIEIDACPGLEFKGVVSRLANSVKNMGGGIGQVSNFEVRVAILPPDHEDGDEWGDLCSLRPGMTAAVRIVTMQKGGIVTVPLQSIFTKGREEFVWVAIDGKVSQRRITTGIQGLRSIEVTDGLAAGEAVVVSPHKAISETLSEGAKVRYQTDRRL